MIKKLFIAILVLAMLFVSVGLWLPVEQRVERNIQISRSPATAFTLLNGFQHFRQWLPWVNRDPQVKLQTGGPETGPGAHLSWQGHPRRVGSGELEIVRSVPFERIDMALSLGPEVQGETYFLLASAESGVELTWGLRVDVTAGRGFLGGLVGRYLGLFLDRWIGPDMAAGLERFRQLAASMPAASFDDADIAIVDVQPLPILFVSGSSSQESTDVTAALAEAFAELASFLDDHGIPMTGQPIAITRAWDETGFHFDAAVPVDAALPPLSGRLQAGYSPAGRAVRIIHQGPYRDILASYEKLAAFIAVTGLAEGALSWEHYVSDPTVTPPEQLVTHVYVLLEN